MRTILPLLLLVFACSTQQPESNNDKLLVPGLKDEVEIIIDQYGVSHIYAQNEEDLFFAQGYNAARDRLFQFEIWRRQSTGTVAEILGERELKRDIGTRLFMYRGNMEEEMKHYHPRGDVIIRAYVEGVNAYIRQTQEDPSLLPAEFEMLGVTPGLWTPEVVISRHQGLLGNIGNELNHGRAVSLLGEEKVKELLLFEPWEPRLSLDEKIPQDLLFEDILELYNAYRRPVWFQPEDVKEKYRKKDAVSMAVPFNELDEYNLDHSTIGSNNWIISGKKSATGFPLMANDPHRTQAVPSLRYIVHLNAPGWNVIGGGEPEIPGISIGHNEHGAWGLTVFRTDGEDLYSYETNPDNPNQYKYKGEWVDFEVIHDTITVKGMNPQTVVYKYTKHGPVVWQDEEKNYAFGMRCAWLEPGGSPYLASLMMDQATTWEEFREACNYSHIPGENMIWADKKGTIGWQAVGIAPVRGNWSGLVPVPGDGSYEWEGYLPIVEKPHVVNPENGYFATANENVVPKDYPNNGAVGFEWSDAFRGQRIAGVLGANDQVTMEEMKVLQTDYYSIPAEHLVPLLGKVSRPEGKAGAAMDSLLSWNFYLEKHSVAAGIYVAWEKELRSAVTAQNVPPEARSYLSIPLTRIVEWIKGNETKYIGERNELLLTCLEKATETLTSKLGDDISKWPYGQEKYKHIILRHPLSQAVNEESLKLLEVGPAPRAGYGYTVGATGSGDNQSSGASFRILVNTGNWDETLAMNTPGQSGDPDSKYYRNLFEQWAEDGFFPLYFSREKIESVKDSVLLLNPLDL
ncbi:MAG: penicillin acylase family protein [Cyclobacteriaceae bacterium]|nr:penicillin acylase family protein [Cyclobacteriaceae bacterium]